MENENDLRQNILVDRYAELLRKESILDALIAAGVDSWEGYELALEDVCNDEQ